MKTISQQVLAGLPSVTLPRRAEFYTEIFGKAAKMHNTIVDYVSTTTIPSNDEGQGSDPVRAIQKSTSAFFVGHVSCMCADGSCNRKPFSFLVIHPSLYSIFPRVVASGQEDHLNMAQKQARDSMTVQDQLLLMQWSHHNAREANKQRSHMRVVARVRKEQPSSNSNASNSERTCSLFDPQVGQACASSAARPCESVSEANSESSLRAVPVDEPISETQRKRKQQHASADQTQSDDSEALKCQIKLAEKDLAVPHEAAKPWLNREARVSEIVVATTKRPFHKPPPSLSAALALPLLIECIYQHSLYGLVKVTADLVFVEQLEPDGVKIRPGRFENYVRQNKYVKPFRALYIHRILDVFPLGTPLDVYLHSYFSSFNASARTLGCSASGWHAWRVVGHSNVSIATVAETLGFLPHPELDADVEVNVPVDHWDTDEVTGKLVQTTVPCPIRDVLAVFCMHECDEVRCGRPQEESSESFYKCPHGIEYLRDSVARLDECFDQDQENEEGSVAKRRKIAKGHDVGSSSYDSSVAGMTWKKRIRFLTVEGSRIYVENIMQLLSHQSHRAPILGKVHSGQLAASDLHWLAQNSGRYVLDCKDLDGMLQYWEPNEVWVHRVSGVGRTYPQKWKIGDGLICTPIQWRLKAPYKLSTYLSGRALQQSNVRTVVKKVLESVLDELKDRIAKGAVQTYSA